MAAHSGVGELMYRAFYGLRERPFDLTPNPRFLVLTDGHREALGNLQYGIESRKGLTLLLGDAGSGKTTIIRAALQRQTSRVQTVYLHNPALTRSEFNEMLASRFKLSPEARASKTTLLIELEELLCERNQRNETTLLVIDEAQTLSLELLEEVRLLANIESLDAKLLSVVLAGQPELGDRLNDPALRQLKQRVALRCELKPLTLYETFGYLAGRIATAGGDGAAIFTREAAVAIHEHSRGLPRTISVIADNALVSGFALNRRPITRDVIEEVCRDFDLPSPRRTPAVPAPVGTAPTHLRAAGTGPAPAPARAPAPAPAPAPVSAPTPPPRHDTRVLAFEPGSPPQPGPATRTAPESAPEHGETGRGGQPARTLFGVFNRKRRSFFGFARHA